MRRTLQALAVLLILLSQPACSEVTPSSVPSPFPEFTEDPATATIAPTLPVETKEPMTPTAIPSTKAQQILQAMTLDQKIGQLFVIGFDGTDVDDDLRAMIEESHIGGVIYFARNIADPLQTAKLSAKLQRIAAESGNPGLIIAIDQEGGRVARLTEKTGFTEFPSAMALGATGDPHNAFLAAQAMAQEMRQVGINADFAPDLDVNNNPLNPVIGIRSFSSDPAIVAAFGVEAVKGLQSEGVMAFGKHFPGHGDTDIDSHKGLPVIDHPLDRLQSVEFVPFEAAIKADVSGIMTAHVEFLSIDPTNTPATVSQPVLTGLLRETMGYEGLIITDSLEMAALGEAGYPTEIAGSAAFMAGADLLLFNRDHDLHRRAIADLKQKLETGKISMERLDESVLRILSVKEEFGVLESPTEAGTPQVMQPDTVTLSRKLALNSVTLVKNEAGLLPFGPEQEVTMVEFPQTEGFAHLLSFSSFLLPAEPTQSDLNLLFTMTRGDQALLFLTTDANMNGDQAEAVRQAIAHGIPTVVVAVRNPHDILAFPELSTYLVSYGSNPPTLDALEAILHGAEAAKGKLPIEIPGMYHIDDGILLE